MPVPAIERLKKRADFVAAAKGRRFHTGNFTLQALAKPALSNLRAGFTVTKREGNAVERNRIRRRLKAALLQTAESYAHVACDIVIVGRRAALQSAYPCLIEDLARGLRSSTRT